MPRREHGNGARSPTGDLPLFAPVPEVPVHARARAPERETAASMHRAAKSLRVRVYHWLRQRGRFGATRDELDQVFDTVPNTMQPRLVRLEELGLIRKTARKRLTRSNRPATVYVVTEVADG